MIVGLTGHAGVGKDTLARALVNRGWVRMAFADQVKAVVHIEHLWARLLVRIFGAERAKRKFPMLRRAYQRTGSAMRAVDPDYWIDPVQARIRHPAYSTRNIVISDVRYPNEAEAIRKEGGVIIRIVRPGHGPLNDHESEVLVNEIHADLLFTNEDADPAYRDQRFVQLVEKYGLVMP